MTILHAERRHRTDHTLDARAKRGAGEFASPSADRHYAPELRLEPVHLDLDLRLDLDAQRLEAAITHTLRANDEGVDELVLHGLDLRELEVEGEGVRHGYDGEELTLSFERPFARGEERKVTLRYAVVEPASGLLFSKPSDAVPDAPWFAVTDHETERARHWLCTVDLPAARPTLAFRVRAAERFTILANGAHAGEETHGDGTKTVSWRLEQPCPSYLTCFAVGDFARWDGGEVDGVPIACFAPASLYGAEHLERSFRRTADMLRWLPERLGVPFPYPKYFQFVVPGIGGAMENISLVSWDDRFMLDEALETEERQLLDVINLHEMAHTWFGDLVVCRDYAHAWLKESWATYMETCWIEHDLGEDAAAYDLWTSARNYIRETEERYRRPIVTRRFDTSWDMYDYHLYPGGAWRLHMLRKLLGEAVFWDATKTYLERYAGKVVETEDFRRVLEEKSGRSLARFFDQWIHGAGCPRVRGRFRWDARRKEGVFELEQRQARKRRKGDAAGPVFDLEVDLAWWVGGERQVHTARFEGERLYAVIPMEKEPERVRVDPERKVLMDLELDVSERLRQAALLEGDVWDRILAGRALAKSGKGPAIRKVVRRFAEEPFWGVRVQLAEALGEAGHEAALAGLVELAKEHDAPESLAALFRALGKYRDARVVEVLRARLEGGLPPRAAEAAWEALGKQREAAPLEKLVEASAKQGFGGFAQAGALRALAHTCDEEAAEVLLHRSAPAAVPQTVRHHAVQALGQLARQLDKRPRERVIEALEDRLRDPVAKVRASAAIGLIQARARDRLGALERYRSSLTKQDASRLKKRLGRLKRSDGALTKAEARIDELEDRLRKLSERLEKAEATLDGREESAEG
ncbi:MAG TPA: M1 family aminopeptidase [Polyangiaceae bacterium LLY-WYZ-15_(1-7)]|nr:M1 family aminopeptidase [Polyangiaceae bacterium LLY-WYZ-15_(1-7)]